MAREYHYYFCPFLLYIRHFLHNQDNLEIIFDDGIDLEADAFGEKTMS
jgi:hypothetical protein